MKTVWTPYPEESDPRRREGHERTVVHPFDFAARPVDPRLIPFAITRNATMVPTLVQNLREYCRSRSPADFEADPAIRKTVERARFRLDAIGEYLRR
jgi:hypothetical protein